MWNYRKGNDESNYIKISYPWSHFYCSQTTLTYNFMIFFRTECITQNINISHLKRKIKTCRKMMTKNGKKYRHNSQNGLMFPPSSSSQ